MNKIEEIFTAWKISFNPNDAQSDIASKRIEICDACEFKEIVTLGPLDIFTRCKVCGCALKAKMYTPVTYRDPGGSCPHEKWMEVEKEWLEKKGIDTILPTSDDYLIADTIEIYSSYDGINYHNVILPTPNENNNNLADRINSSIILTCNSTWSIRIKVDNTDLVNSLSLDTGQSAKFVFDGKKWMFNER